MAGFVYYHYGRGIYTHLDEGDFVIQPVLKNRNVLDKNNCHH
jgi:hypothetical protein